ncbi:glycosyltransferase family 2 protein [Streptomyces sp. NPDC018031]|uniref:glycosyltransferase family 2 protein n=1 Tax=Streptomyces sp. NPDC018031 TaxID=3365033 RepID=UPI003799899C
MIPTSLKVSVVVPVHNTGKTVLTGLTSFREQTFPRAGFEVLYVDDGSTDDTPDLIASEIAGEENFRLIRGHHSGWPGRPRNIGIDAARGSYVHFVDDDDHLAPRALERLYARAVETGADIVAGRTAGHGRGVSRVLYEEPMSAGDIRTDPALLTSMTVHKLFRRELLTAHGIRFPEGRVRLEDHMFMLRAYFAARRVATVHDYTCYHWVRHDDGVHNISFSRVDPRAYLASVRAILGIVTDHLEPGPLREEFIAHWYANKALYRLEGEKFTGKPAWYRRQVFRAVRSLARDCVPPAVDRRLPAKHRIASALVRHGDRGLLEEYAAFESGTGHRPRLEGLRWQDGALRVRISTELVRPTADGRTVPVLFDRTGGRRRLWLPPRLAAVPGVAEAADFTDAVSRATVTGQIRHRDEATVLPAPTTLRAGDSPAAAPHRPPAGPGPGRPRRTVRDLLPVRPRPRRTARPASAPAPSPPLHGLRFEAEFAIDPAAADHGRALHGVWDVFARLDCCGWASNRRLGADRAERVEEERMPAFCRSDRPERSPHLFVNPYWTRPHDNLSVSVDGTLAPLNRTVRDPRGIELTGTGGHLSAVIPLALAAPDRPVPVTVLLERDGATLLSLPEARVEARSGLSVLAFEVSADRLAAALAGGPAELRVAHDGRTGRLRLVLAPDPATGRVTVGR